MALKYTASEEYVETEGIEEAEHAVLSEYAVVWKYVVEYQVSENVTLEITLRSKHNHHIGKNWKMMRCSRIQIVMHNFENMSVSGT